MPYLCVFGIVKMLNSLDGFRFSYSIFLLKNWPAGKRVTIPMRPIGQILSQTTIGGMSFKKSPLAITRKCRRGMMYVTG